MRISSNSFINLHHYFLNDFFKSNGLRLNCRRMCLS